MRIPLRSTVFFDRRFVFFAAVFFVGEARFADEYAAGSLRTRLDRDLGQRRCFAVRRRSVQPD